LAFQDISIEVVVIMMMVMKENSLGNSKERKGRQGQKELKLDPKQVGGRLEG
jgi:hypothetical protein